MLTAVAHWGLCAAVVAAHEPSYMTVPLACDSEGFITIAAKDPIAEAAQGMTCLACGPGLGRSSHLTELVGWLYEALPQPIVFDADALFALAQQIDSLGSSAGPRVLTPHIGELRRFMAGATASSRDEYEQFAVELASSSQIVCVLKGHRTLITDGDRRCHSATGNPGMATGGTGDVLTGVIAAFLAQGLTPFDAAQLGCHVHGLAGDLAARQLGEASLIASDLVQYLPHALKQISPAAGPQD